MKSALKVFAGVCLLLFWGGLVSCSNDTESAVIDITPIIAYDTTTVTDDSLSPEEIKMLYKMREPDHRISGAEIVTLIDNVIGILDEETGLKSGDGRKVRSITPLVSENSKAVALKSGGEPEIEIPDTLAYVVNFEDSLGFAILAADTRVEQPVLGFVDQGSLIDSTDNPGIALVLESLENHILNSIIETEKLKDSLLNEILEKLETESGTKAMGLALSVTESPWNTISKVSPLIPVEWGQGPPYNNNVGGKCSGDGTAENGKYWAGCVATAVAQIMAYWKYPAKISNYSLDWNTLIQYTGMQNSNSSDGRAKKDINTAPATIKNQIATLFRQIGKEIYMDYGCKGSSAQRISALKFLRKHGFNMPLLPIEDVPITLDYNSDDVINSLNKRRPLMIEGCSEKINHKFLGITIYTTHDNCHDWVMDGYLKQKKTITLRIGSKILVNEVYTDYLHNNWGWDGDKDGYFISGIFDARQEPALASNTKSNEDYNYQYKLNVGYIWR
ncbi:MAG: C10 family peptidase [Fibrobacter sp.]|jgi:hypothetical protein|nr:C10 family peptidase [Fibrobacter sp.]